MATIAENIQTLRSIKSDIKNAIIQKGGSVTDAFGTYAQAITDLPSGGGGTESEDALVMRTMSSYYNNRVSKVGDYAFANCFSLISIDIPNCTNIGYNAFAWCSALSSVNFPNCSYVSNNAFNWCSALTSVNFPLCSYVGDFAFANCNSLTSINLPNCSSVGNYAFGYCSSLSSINLPLCEYVGGDAFRNCSNLAQVYLNSVTSVTTISGNTFIRCPNLTSVYVPASLVDAFKTAPNWSSISNKIVAYTGA